MCPGEGSTWSQPYLKGLLILKDTAVVSKVISENTSHSEPSVQIVILDAACSGTSLEHVFSNQDSC